MLVRIRPVKLLLIGVLLLPGNILAESNNTLDPELLQLYESTGINPFDYAAANNLAVKLATEGDYELAEKILQRAVRLEPGRKDIHENLEMVRTWIRQIKNLPVADVDRYQKSFRKRDVPALPNSWNQSDSIAEPQDSISNRQNILTDEPANLDRNPFAPETLMTRAEVSMRKGDYRDAVSYLERAKQLDPFRTDIDFRINQIRALAPEVFINRAFSDDQPGDVPTEDNASGTFEEIPKLWSTGETNE